MKMDVLAIPPARTPTTCAAGGLSMRTPDDPEYVPVELSARPPVG